MTARPIEASLGSGARATEEAVDRREALVPDVDAVLVHVESDVRSADLVGHLLRERADVLAARFRVREGVLDRGADRRLDPADQGGLAVGPREDTRGGDRRPRLAF